MSYYGSGGPLPSSNVGLTPATKVKISGMFRHGSRSFSRHIVCRSEVCAANHRRGDSFGTQCRSEPGPNILNVFPYFLFFMTAFRE